MYGPTANSSVTSCWCSKANYLQFNCPELLTTSWREHTSWKWPHHGHFLEYVGLVADVGLISLQYMVTFQWVAFKDKLYSAFRNQKIERNCNDMKKTIKMENKL